MRWLNAHSLRTNYFLFIHILHHQIYIPGILQEPSKFWYSIIPHKVSVDKGCTNTTSDHLNVSSRRINYLLFIHILQYLIYIASSLQEPPKFWHSIILHNVSCILRLHKHNEWAFERPIEKEKQSPFHIYTTPSDIYSRYSSKTSQILALHNSSQGFCR